MERFGDIIVRADTQALDIQLDGGTCGEQYHRDVTGVKIALYELAQLCSRHFGHNHIAHHNARHLTAYQLPAFFSVGGRQYLVEWLKDIGEHLANGLIVFYNQHFGIRNACDGRILFQFCFQEGICFRLGNFNLTHTIRVPADLFFRKELIA